MTNIWTWLNLEKNIGQRTGYGKLEKTHGIEMWHVITSPAVHCTVTTTTFVECHVKGYAECFSKNTRERISQNFPTFPLAPVNPSEFSLQFFCLECMLEYTLQTPFPFFFHLFVCRKFFPPFPSCLHFTPCSALYIAQLSDLKFTTHSIVSFLPSPLCYFCSSCTNHTDEAEGMWYPTCMAFMGHCWIYPVSSRCFVRSHSLFFGAPKKYIGNIGIP
jgi:hypothetical protein